MRTKSYVSKTQIAKDLGISKGRVTQLIAKGLPVREDGKIDYRKARQWYEANIRGKVKPHAAGSEAVERNEPQSGAPEDDDAPREDFTGSRARREKAQADLAEFELARLRHEYCELAAVKRMLGGLVVAAKTRLRAIANKMAPELAIETNPAAIQAAIEAEVDEALTELSHWEPEVA
jgi:hypothetical protein